MFCVQLASTHLAQIVFILSLAVNIKWLSSQSHYCIRKHFEKCWSDSLARSRTSYQGGPNTLRWRGVSIDAAEWCYGKRSAATQKTKKDEPPMLSNPINQFNDTGEGKMIKVAARSTTWRTMDAASSTQPCQDIHHAEAKCFAACFITTAHYRASSWCSGIHDSNYSQWSLLETKSFAELKHLPSARLTDSWLTVTVSSGAVDNGYLS